MISSSRLKPYLECKEYFKQLTRRCLNGQHLIVKEEMTFLMNFLKSLNTIEKSDSIVQCIRVCVYTIIEVHDPDEDYKNYTYMDRHIRQPNGIAWMVDNYFNKSIVNKYYQILMTNLLNPTKQSILKLTNTFEIDSLKLVDYKYFLIKLVHFNIINKLKTNNTIIINMKNIFDLNKDLNQTDDIINYLSQQHIYSHQRYNEIVSNMNLILVE